MWTRQHRKRSTGRLIVPAIAALFLAYFGFHAFHGEYGLYAKYRLEERIVVLNEELAELRLHRSRFEDRLQLLHDGTLEKDMLDEQARRALGFLQADEIVIIREEPASGD
jgi:cell division protein FtsB